MIGNTTKKCLRGLAALLLVLGLGAGYQVADTEPADAHTVSTDTTRAICVFINPNSNTWWLIAYRTVHYGTAHVTQCAYTYTTPITYSTVLCQQYVWNVPNPWVDTYFSPSRQSPYCW